MAPAGDNQDTGPEGVIVPEGDALPGPSPESSEAADLAQRGLLENPEG